MADNYLERHMRDYEEKKALWIARKKHMRGKINGNIRKPEDESL